MTAYSYNDNLEYIGTVTCQRDPVRSRREGKACYLTPANATLTPPPEFDPDTEIPVWDGNLWSIRPIEKEPEPEDVQAAPYTETELIQQDITDLQLADIEQGQEITELFLTQLGG